jgi:hypothetical protein
LLSLEILDGKFAPGDRIEADVAHGGPDGGDRIAFEKR